MKNKIVSINKILPLLLIALFSGCFTAAGSTLTAEADSAYKAKDYERAVQLYKSVADEHGTSVALLYDLGNAYFHQGDYGNAMLCYKRAHRLDPSSSEVNANLTYLTSRVEDANKAEQKGKRFKTGTDEPSFFQSVHKYVAEDVSSNFWASFAAAGFIIFVGCAALYIFSRGVVLRKIGFFGGIVVLGVSIVLLLFAFMGARAYHNESEGVLMAFKTTLQTEPGKESEQDKGQVLTKGTVVQVLSEEVDAEGNVTWYKVRLNSDYIGWVVASDLQII